MDVTLFGIVRDVKFVQLENADSSILFTLLGIDREVMPLHPKKAFLPMVVTPSLIVTFSRDVTLLNNDVIVSQSKTASFILLQSLNILLATLVGLQKTNIVFRLRQPEKASKPM